MTWRRPTLAVLVAVLLVVAPASSGIAASVSPGPDESPQGGPPGHVGVPSSNVQVGGPGGGPPGGLPDHVPKEAAAWSVHTSKHAAALEVTVTTTADGELAIQFTDDVNHDGREVAVNASALEQAIGYRPKSADGLHEDGSRWSSTVEYERGMAVITIPRFSTNTVTYSGEAVINANPATNQSTYTYDTGDRDSVSDFSINVTGSTATEWDNVSATDVRNGDSIALDASGNLAPVGPSANNKPVVEVTNPPNVDILYRGMDADNLHAHGYNGGDKNYSQSVLGLGKSARDFDGDGDLDVAARLSDGSLAAIDDNGNVQTFAESTTYPGGIGDIDGDGDHEIAFESGGYVKYVEASGTVTNLSVAANYVGGVGDIDGDGDTDIAYADGADTLSYIDAAGNIGTVGVSTAKTVGGVGDIDGDADLDIAYTDGADALKFVDAGGTVTDLSTTVTVVGGVGDIDDDGDTDIVYREQSTNALKTVDQAGNVYDTGNSSYGPGPVADFAAVGPATSTSVDVDGDGTADASVSNLADETTETAELDGLTTSNDTAAVTTDYAVDLTFRFEERTQTVDPTVSVNGNPTGYSGSLADGETVALDTNTSWIQSGSNTVEVTVDPAVSSDAPTPAVGLEYRHTAETKVDVSVTSETWTERYDHQRTWSGSVTNATLTIPFNKNVVGVRDLTYYLNGTETAVSWSRFNDADDELVVGLGNLETNATTQVVVNASKVHTHNASINVVEPTIDGNSLDSKVEIVTWDSGAYIDVSGTSENDLVHYTTDESWSTPKEYVEIEAGDQRLKMPNAVAGGTFNVTTMPLGADTDGGVAELVVNDPTEPRFHIRKPDSNAADAVYLTFYDVTSGETYRLYSVTNDAEIMKDTAESPVFFNTGGFDETYIIELASGGSNVAVAVSGDSDGGGGFGPAALVAALAAAILGAFIVGRRYLGARGLRDNTVLFVVGGVVGVVGLEMVTPRSIVSTLVLAVSRLLGELTGAVALALEDAATSGAGALLAAFGIMLGLRALDNRYGLVSTRGYIVAGVGLAAYVIQSLTEGALSPAVETVGPLLIVVGAIGGIWLLVQIVGGRDIVIQQVRGGGGGGSQ